MRIEARLSHQMAWRGVAALALAVALLLALGGWLEHQSATAASDRAPATAVYPTLLTPTLPLTYSLYLPLVIRPTQVMTEVRAVWISRFDWTRSEYTPTVADVQHLVDLAAQAGFNTLLFQVRGAGDAYYTPGLEPWASRLTGSLGPTLGQDPGWDPLAEIITRAHAAGLKVHAWLNVYPTWLPPPSAAYGTLTPTLDIWPPHALNRFTYSANGGYGLGYTWRVYDRAAPDGYMRITWNQYTWASPAVPQVQDHIAAVVADIVSRYAVDGIHLDHVRYPGPQYSFDPFTLAAFARDPLSHTLTITDWRPAFQRAQVTQLVARLTTETHTTHPSLAVSAAVWPSYSRGYEYYYQDSQSWLLNGVVDAIAPMLYSSEVITDLEKWTAAVTDFQAHSGGRGVWPGIGVESGGACVPFVDIAARIQTARGLGTAGHAIFSLTGLERCGYLDDLREGPYRLSP